MLEYLHFCLLCTIFASICTFELKIIKATLSGQIVKSLGHSIINKYSMGACAALGINNQEALSTDLENDLFLYSALQRFTCELYYRFGLFLAPLSVGIITSRHYLYERNKNGEWTSGTSEMGDNKNGGDEKTAEWAQSYWSCSNCRGVRFLVWGWSCFRQ